MIRWLSRDLRGSLWWLLGLLAFGDLAAPLLLGPIEPPVLLHHLEHGLLMAIGGAFGLRLARRPQATAGGTAPGWLIASVLLSGLAVALMAPDLYGYVDAHPLAHAILHLAFFGNGWLATYAAERYSRGFGAVWLGLILFMTAIAATGFGVQRNG